MRLDSLFLDLHHAWRGLRRAPGLAVTAILTLALGIGANLTIFSIVDAALLKPLPYADPEQLAVMYSVYKRGTPDETFFVNDLTWNRLDAWRNEREIFSAIATYGGVHRVTVDAMTPSGDLRVRGVSPELLRLLGIAPRLGRWFDDADIGAGGTVVLLSEPFWRRAFAGDSHVLGRTLLVEGRPHAIVGVMPAAFSYGLAATVGWIPFDEAAERLKAKSTFGTIMRLRPGLSLEQGERLVDAAADRMQRERPGASPWTVDLGLLDSRRGDPSTRRALGVFAAAVALILLIACANVANLLLGRTLSRQREIGVRTALGASRSQLVRLLLTEAFVLVCIGMVLSIGFAWWAARVLPALVPEALGLFARNPMSIDLRVLAGAALLMIAIPVLCSIAPAYRATRRDVIGALEGSARVVTGGRSSRRLWQALQAVQILLTFVLLIGAGLLGSSFVRMLRADAGYDVDRLVAVTLDVPSSRYTDRAAREGFYRAVLDRVRSLPGVEAAAYGSHPAGGGSGRLTIAGREQEDLRLPPLSLYGVDANYFATMGIPIKHGRGFTAADMESAADGAIVVDERLAAMFWPGESPLGKQLRFGLVPVWSTVVGVAASVKTRHFAARGGTIQAYYPLPSSNALVLRTQRPDDVIALLRPAVKGIDPVVDIYRASSAADLYGDVLTTPRFSLVVMLAFGLLALVTAAVGLSAVISQAVARRTPEIGLRIALGAQLGQIRALVMREAVAPMTAGIGGGLLVAFWVTQYLDAMLYQVAPHDPATYAAVLTFLAVVAGAAALIPARRAARLDPVQTLREK